jgi:translation initiation factor IF-2
MAKDVKERKIVEIPPIIGVRLLAERLGIGPVDLLKALIANGMMVSITESIDFESAAIVAEDFGVTLQPEGTAARAAAAKPVVAIEARDTVEPEAPGPSVLWYLRGENEADLVPRDPVVTVMGHVDHGKTSLLDRIRNTRVAAGESGGITQHIGAYTVKRDGGRITFIDTPGHEAFTAMRARGAQVTDVAVIVIAAEDGVMPQTREAIDHARAAGVPMVVAITKVDLPNARPDRVMEQMAELKIIPDAWGGDTFFVPVSAVTGVGIDELLDAILLVAEAAVPRTNPNRRALGTVIEGRIDQQRGITATVLVQSGTLHTGDVLVIDTQQDKVRALFDERGKRIKDAGPSTPVEIMGLSSMPDAGARFEVVATDRNAKALVASRIEGRREPERPDVPPMTLEELYVRMTTGEVKALNLIVKTDVQGTLEPVVEALQRLTGDIKVEILHAATGEISERDINLAAASRAVVLGFRVGPDGPARRAATAQNVEVREYDVIYALTEDIQDALTGMLDPVYAENVIGRAEIRQVFTIPRHGHIAGCAVTRGVIRRNATVRVLRGDEALAESGVSSLKRFTEDVREVRDGFECGIGLASFDAFQEGDVLEFYVRERVR